MRKVLWWGTGLALLVGASLTVMSALGLCDLKCSQAADYRLFGFPFELSGGLFFALALLLFALQRKAYLLILLLAGCGAEIVMLATQALVIGSACPLCMGVAATVFSATGMMAYLEFNRSDVMRWSVLPVMVALIVTIMGVGKVDQMQAAESALKEAIRFGKVDQPYEAYLFTDWGCGGCRKVEPKLSRLMPQILRRSSLIFIDFPVHPVTYNYMPYNLSLMLHGKEKYLASRIALGKLAEEVFSPEEQEVAQALEAVGGSFRPLPYLQVVQGLALFEDTVEELGVEFTPTLVVINRKTGEKKMLVGSESITEESINELIR